MKDRGMSRDDFIEKLGQPREYTEALLVGEAVISPEVAEILAEVLGASAAFWIKRDTRYHADRARLTKKAE
jgi:plasmid maintenance system antidote protein VapI